MVQILIVEDDEQVRVLAEGILQEAGHKTLSAGSADQALALLEEGEKVDVILPTLPSNPTPTPDWCWRKKQ